MTDSPSARHRWHSRKAGESPDGPGGLTWTSVSGSSPSSGERLGHGGAPLPGPRRRPRSRSDCATRSAAPHANDPRDALIGREGMPMSGSGDTGLGRQIAESVDLAVMRRGDRRRSTVRVSFAWTLLSHPARTRAEIGPLASMSRGPSAAAREHRNGLCHTVFQTWPATCRLRGWHGSATSRTDNPFRHRPPLRERAREIHDECLERARVWRRPSRPRHAPYRPRLARDPRRFAPAAGRAAPDARRVRLEHDRPVPNDGPRVPEPAGGVDPVMTCRAHCGVRTAIAAAVVLVSSGCASTAALSGDPNDSWEPANRAAYAFNDALDRAVLGPAAHLYRPAARAGSARPRPGARRFGR